MPRHAKTVYTLMDSQCGCRTLIAHRPRFWQESQLRLTTKPTQPSCDKDRRSEGVLGDARTSQKSSGDIT